MKKLKFENIYGKQVTVGCLSCDLIRGKVEVPGGSVLLTKYFEAHTDFEIPIPGFIILVSRRHIKSVDEFSRSEQLDFINSLVKLRTNLRKILKIKTIYLIQEEDTSSHFHVWMFPRHPWMERFGTKIESVRPIMEFARKSLKTPNNLKKVKASVDKVKKYLI